MNRTLIAAIIGFAVTCFSVPAIADTGAYILPAIPANAQITISLGGSADQATTLPGAVALGEDSIATDTAGVKPMIGGADVLAFSNQTAGIRAGSSNNQIGAGGGVDHINEKPEVGWQIPYSA